MIAKTCRPMNKRAVLVWHLAAAFALLCSSSVSAQTPPGYMASERPDASGTPTRVELGLYLLDLSQIVDPRQEFSVDIHLTAKWRDTRLATNEEDVVLRTLLRKEVWNPSLGALNRRAVTQLLPETVKVDSSGNVQYDQRIQGDFSSSFDLRQFPHDRQELIIRIASYYYGPDELEIQVNEAKTGRLDDLSVAGWVVGQPAVDVASLVIPGGKTRSGLTFKVEVERETTYYFLTMVIPLLLIALMAWSVFWIDPAFLPSQIGVSTASVFSLIAFRLGLSLSLPKVAYLTRADALIMAVTVLVFAAFGEAVLTGALSKAGRGDLARTVDRWARWAYMAILVVVGFSLV